jgi:hypothetical protein
MPVCRGTNPSHAAFRRQTDATVPEASPGSDIAALKGEVSSALDALKQRINAVLTERKADEQAAKRWILFIGVFLVLLIVASIALQGFAKGTTTWLGTLFSGLSVAGLLYLLYSPVQRIMAIANDRATLQLIPMAYRIRIVVETTN